MPLYCVYLSHRINRIAIRDSTTYHDFALACEALNRLEQQHPECQYGAIDQQQPNGYWSVLRQSHNPHYKGA